MKEYYYKLVSWSVPPIPLDLALSKFSFAGLLINGTIVKACPDTVIKWAF